jgi:aspartyl-tRNA(Asn)/glutamyl-tRNA(Gln) amidotransferase subunit B
MTAHGLSEYDADLLVRLISGAADYFETMVAAGASAKGASNWVQGEIRRRLKDLGSSDMAVVDVPADALAELIVLTEQGVISSTVAKDVFEKMWGTGRGARAIVDAEGLGQIADTSALEAMAPSASLSDR